MKIVAIGDIHGRDIWQRIVEKELPDLTVFVGDYFDSLDIPYLQQMNNFKQIIKFKESYSKQVILLLGNHDIHYDDWAMQAGEHYTGYQAIHAKDISDEFYANKKLFQIAFKKDNLLFSHAGISIVWLKNMGIANDESKVDIINDLYIYRPSTYCFNTPNPSFPADSYGDNIWQGPTWIRPKSLIKSSKSNNQIQIVGHTKQNQIDIQGKATGSKFFFIDTLGTSQEYLIIDDGEIKAGKI